VINLFVFGILTAKVKTKKSAFHFFFLNTFKLIYKDANWYKNYVNYVRGIFVFAFSRGQKYPYNITNLILSNSNEPKNILILLWQTKGYSLFFFGNVYSD
jgi:hypothetical protein